MTTPQASSVELEQELSFLARAAAEFYFVSLKFKSLFLIKTIYTKSYLTIFVLPQKGNVNILSKVVIFKNSQKLKRKTTFWNYM